MTAAVSAAGTAPKTALKTRENPYEIVNRHGFLDVLSVRGTMTGSVITLQPNKTLTATHLANLPGLIKALENNENKTTEGSLDLLKSLLPKDAGTPAGSDTVTDLLVTSDTQTGIVIPKNTSPTSVAVAIESTDQPAAPFPAGSQSPQEIANSVLAQHSLSGYGITVHLKASKLPPNKEFVTFTSNTIPSNLDKRGKAEFSVLETGLKAVGVALGKQVVYQKSPVDGGLQLKESAM